MFTSSWQYVELLDLTVMIKINALQPYEGKIGTATYMYACIITLFIISLHTIVAT